MANKRLLKVWSKRHLPLDPWAEILSRLPVKSLLRFRCVSNSWLSLIDGPDFIRLHLNNFKNNRHETQLLVFEHNKKGKLECVLRYSGTFELNTEALLTPGDWKVMFSVDGLVLLKSSQWRSRFRDLKVWNPSIRKFHTFPPMPETETPLNTYVRDAEIGLGYDPLIKDYKCVKLIFASHDIFHSVAVYTLLAGSWKIIQFKGKGCSDWHWKYPKFVGSKPVYLQGILYFIAEDVSGVWELVSFGLSSEEFSSISLPEDPFFTVDGFKGQLFLVDGGHSLAVYSGGALFVLESSKDEEGESLCWTKRYEMNKIRGIPFYLTKKGDMLLGWSNVEAGITFRLVNEEELVSKQRWNLVTSYNIVTKKHKILLQEISSGMWSNREAFGYIESLVLLK